ncbi:MAG: flavodoxin family protein [Candidatus Omnitrophota bacterium]
MKVLGIIGSPRKQGNTDILLDKALEGAKSKGAQVEKIVLNDLKMIPCQEHEKVRDDGACFVQDDMQPIYEKIKDCDVLILASPIFFGSLSAQTKIMVDRFQCPWRAKYMLKKDIGYKKKKGYFISAEGSNRDDFFQNAKSIVKNLFATINAEYKGELFCPKVDDKGDILKHETCLEKAFELGVNI